MDFGSQLPASPNQSPVRGLNLLFLLVENRLAEFHSELELMDDVERAEECVVFPVQLEQYLMVGSYDQVRRGRAVLFLHRHSFHNMWKLCALSVLFIRVIQFGILHII